MLRANALTLRAIFAVMAGRVADPQLGDLRMHAAGGDDLYELVLGFVVGCAQMRSDPRKALVSLEQSMRLADRLGIDLGSIVNRSLSAVGLAMVGSLPEALVGLREALSWSAERGMWSSALNDFTTAAIVLDRADRTEVAITLLSARHHSGFATGFGTNRASMIDQLRVADPDRFAHSWKRGERLDTSSATTFALRTIDELLASTTRD